MENGIGKICPYCKEEIKEGETVKICHHCGVFHHEDCWNANKGCSTFGCTEHNDEIEGNKQTAVCSNCGAILDCEQLFCPNCGQKVELSGDNSAYSNENFNQSENIEFTAQKLNKVVIFNVIGLLTGVLSAIFGFVIFGFGTGSKEGALIYGGDAYTGIQNAAAQTANNVQKLTEIVKFAFGSLLLVVGIAVFCYFGAKLTSYIQNKEKKNTN